MAVIREACLLLPLLCCVLVMSRGDPAESRRIGAMILAIGGDGPLLPQGCLMSAPQETNRGETNA
jgi:hypothetical protein